MGTITRQAWKCDRCDHEWLSRDNEEPLRCASCKSPYWNKPRKKGVEIAKKHAKRKINESRQSN